MINFKLLFIGLLIALRSQSQSISPLQGARANGIANATSCIQDEWSVFNNIAGLAKVKSATVGFSGDVRPQLNGASRLALVYANPLKFGVMGVGLNHFGDILYNEQTASLAFSNTFGITSLGAKINCVQYNAQGFGSNRILSISFGAVTQLTPQLSIGIYAVNINQPKISNAENERLPAILVAGLGFTLSEKIFATTEIEKNIIYQPKWKNGLEYQAHKKVFLRTGFTLNSDAIYFGFGFRPQKFKLDYAYSYEPLAGGNHQASVGYKFKAR